MGDAYPELKEKQSHCELVLKAEEEGFNRTLDKGLELFESIAAGLNGEKQARISGSEAFKLYDTYGFPLDLTQLMAEERGLEVDLDGFNREMENQKNLARQSGKFVATEDQTKWEVIAKEDHSVFQGYDRLQCQSRLCLLGEDQDYWHLVFQETPFYGESGGQVGDVGQVKVADREFAVADTVKVNDRIVHLVRKAGEFPRNATQFTLEVNQGYRQATACNHTSTHLLQAALRQVLGDHIHQAGSLVTPERLRFDFNHFEKITADQLREVESLVNKVIAASVTVCTEELSYQEAVKSGATALFNEKYGDRVRVVKVAGVSSELCGGTHVSNTAQIRVFRIISESSVATGVRRIEAVTANEALKLYAQERETLAEINGILKTDSNQVVNRINSLTTDYNRLLKEVVKNSQDQAAEQVAELFEKITEFNGIKYIVARVDGLSMELLRTAVDRLRDQMGSGVAILGSVNDSKPAFVVGVTKDLTPKVQAGNLIKAIAAATGGSGGGRPDLAQAGGRTNRRLTRRYN